MGIAGERRSEDSTGGDVDLYDWGLRAWVSTRILLCMDNAVAPMTNNEMRSWLFRKLDERYEAGCLTQYELRCREGAIEDSIPENDETYRA